MKPSYLGQDFQETQRGIRHHLHLLGADAAIPIRASGVLRAELRGASRIAVFEGLPSQRRHDALLAEAERADVFLVSGFPFYQAELEAKPASPIVRTLANPENLGEFSGEKRCGGFHPDFTICWESPYGPFQALLCFGCQEVLFAGGGNHLRYDLAPWSVHCLKEELTKLLPKRSPSS